MGRLLGSARGAAGVGGLVSAVTSVTAAHALHALPARTIAATPGAVLTGKFWLLLSSGLMVDRPVIPSLLTFAVFAVLTLTVCGSRVLWWSAVLGHVGSAAAVYLLIGLTRIVAVTAFDRLLATPDYGVSAIQAAWLGATALVVWRRHCRRAWQRAGIVAACGAIATIGWALRPDLNVISSEHAIAFVIGIVIAGRLPVGGRRVRSEAGRSDRSPRVARGRPSRRLTVVLSALALSCSSVAAASLAPPLTGPLGGPVVRRVATTKPRAALVVDAPPAALPDLVRQLAAHGAAATFALSRPPAKALATMLSRAGDEAIPAISGRLITHWLSAREDLQRWKRSLGRRFRLYYLAQGRGRFTLADTILMHANGGLRVAGPDIGAPVVTQPVGRGQVVVVHCDHTANSSLELALALARLDTTGVAAVPLRQLLGRPGPGPRTTGVTGAGSRGRNRLPRPG